MDGKRQDGSRQDRVPIVVDAPSAFNLRAGLETGDETMPLQASAGGSRSQNMQAQPVVLLGTGEEETEAMTSKWAKGTGGPAGDEEQNLVVEQTPAGDTAATLTTGAHPNSNAPARRKEDDVNLVVERHHQVFDASSQHGSEDTGTGVPTVSDPDESLPLTTRADRYGIVAYDVQPVSSTKQQANALEAKETEVAGALTESAVNRRSDRGTIIVEAVGGDQAHALTGEGYDATEDGTGRGTPIVFESRHIRGQGPPPSEDVPSLKAHTSGGRTSSDAEPLVFESRVARNGRGAPEEVAPPLKAQSGRTGKGDSAPMVAFAKRQRAHHPEDDESWAETDEAPTLDAAGHGPRTATAIVDGLDTRNQQATGDEAQTLTDPHGTFGDALPAVYEDAPTLRGYGHGAQGQHNDDAAAMGLVRRLTPVECERLQALPDGWTDVGAAADSRRYAALGDAVTASVSYWVARRLVERTP